MRYIWSILFLSLLQSTTIAQTRFCDSLLTLEERNWLAKNKKNIRYAPNPSWPPGDYIDENGIHQGIVSDYIKVFEEKLGVKFQNVYYHNWPEILEGLKKSEVDFVGAIHKTAEREEHLIFTDIFLKVPLVILVKNNNNQKLTEEHINSMTLACVKGYSSLDYVKSKYPEAKIVECDDDLSAILQTSIGNSEGAVMELMSASFFVDKYGINNLNLGAELDFTWQLRFACQKRQTVLCTILDKVLKTIDNEKRRKIFNKWVPISKIQEKNFLENNLNIILIITGILLLSLLFILTTNQTLRRLVKGRTLELQTAKEKAVESEKQLKLIADNFVNGMIYQVATIDENKRRFNYVSEAVTKLYGCTVEEAKDNPDLIYSKLHQDDINGLLEKEKEALNEMSIFQAEARVINPNGTIRWSYYISKPRIINEIVCWDGIEIDITERKQMELELLNAKEKAEESNRLKTAFLANLSHEIRTPMNAILGFTSLLKEPDLSSAKMDNYINIIHKSGNYLLSVITDIVEVSKLDARQVSVNFSEFNINNFARVVYESMLVNLPKEKDIDFIYEKSNIPENTVISTDDVKLKQIILNLITNAFKYTLEGRVVFKYNLTEDNNLEIIVKDTGIGIAEKYHEIIFERFRQVEIENRIFQQGSGLGLSICKAYTELLGGTLSVQSEPDKGSTFTVSIPVKIIKQSIHKEESVSVIDIHSEHIKLLIAEDDEINYLYITEILGNSNFTIYHAFNGVEVINMLKEIPGIGLILMDIKMPVMNGYETLKRILLVDSEGLRLL